MDNKEKAKRTNIEVLRILSMFLVVVSHCIYHGIKPNEGFQSYYQLDSLIGSLNWFTMEALYLISCVAVNCFVMISGYFLIEKVQFRWNGILRTWIQTVFYCLCFLVLSLLGGRNCGVKDVISNLLPIFGGKYWFVTCYIGLMLIAPFLSKVAISVSKKQYTLLLVIMLCLNFQFPYGDIYGGFNTIMWFAFLYLVAGYVRLHNIPPFFVKYKGILLIGCWIALVAFALLFNIVTGGGVFYLVSTAYHGPVFFLSLLVFIYFTYTKMEGGFSRIICTIAPYTFGVYLIHDNYFVREWLWNTFIPSSFVVPMAVYCLILAFCIFIICILIDYVRAQLFNLLRVDKMLSCISSKLPKL